MLFKPPQTTRRDRGIQASIFWPKGRLRTRAHIRVAWATPIDPAAKGKPLAMNYVDNFVMASVVDAVALLIGKLAFVVLWEAL